MCDFLSNLHPQPLTPGASPVRRCYANKSGIASPTQWLLYKAWGAKIKASDPLASAYSPSPKGDASLSQMGFGKTQSQVRITAQPTADSLSQLA